MEIVVNSASRATLLSLQSTSRSIDLTSLRLSTGLKVNTALDNPQNFFASSALKNESSDFNRLLDGIGQSARTIQTALHGVETTSKLLNQAETIAIESREKLLNGEVDDQIYEVEKNIVPASLDAQILQASPDVYYRLDNVGATATDFGGGGGVTATYNGGVSTGAPALYNNGGTFSADFDGINDRIVVQNSNLINVGARPERTIELVFNADDVTTRQVLYEEGGGTNSFNIYIENGEVFVTGTDQNVWGPNSLQGPTNIRAAITTGQTYHVALVFSSFNNRFEGFLDGSTMGDVSVGNTPFPSHTGGVGIGSFNGGAWFDTVSSGGNGSNFNGRISNVAIYNDALDGSVIASHANSLNARSTIEFHHRDFENVMNEINQVAFDASYRGINLLWGENLSTTFNPLKTSTIVTDGVDFRRFADAVPRNDFNNLNHLNNILEKLTIAKDALRDFSSSLVSDLNIIETRKIYTREYISTLQSGSDDLTLIDQNKAGANFLALQTRQQLGVTALSLASQSNQSVLRLF